MLLLSKSIGFTLQKMMFCMLKAMLLQLKSYSFTPRKTRF
ncbi:hypothetical protein HMPREF9151_02014 [Hoylesella saccharolytica F0055]|uniref:Uncharacterized protein n=1 Tax=Hoylesella saccharolytica F0055 TaxID=1127699 RepID=L1N4R6_9BACT|nr:hypothetical protein HMPREF9151_02014 [Hoylesella saccharolytica F0055]